MRIGVLSATLATVLIFLSPLAGAGAEEMPIDEGVFDRYDYTYQTEGYGTITCVPCLFDNDLGKGMRFNKYNSSSVLIEILIDDPVEIGYLFYSGDRVPSTWFVIRLYDEQDKVVLALSTSSIPENGYYEVNKKIKKISLAKNVVDREITINELELFETKLPDTTPPSDVTGLTAEAGDGEVTLRYSFPSDDDFSHVKIYQDGNPIADKIKTTTYKVTGLSNGRKYTFRVVAVDTSGNESAGVTVSATPQEVSREVQNVRVTAKHDRVNLSWTNPKRNDFHHVKIYRKTLQNQALKIIPVAHAAEAEGYDPIFETNGTYFNDLTVQPETSYEYKLTTEDKNGVESTGVTVQVTTPPIPPPSTGGTTIIRHENGDVTVRWTPQPGQMIIEIDGVEYRRVDAQLGEYTIPASDIPVDENGKPAPIRLIPIAPNGDMGTPIVINPGGWLIALPFGAKELLEAGIDLLLVFGPIIFMVLVLWYVRPIMRLLREAARGRVRT